LGCSWLCAGTDFGLTRETGVGAERAPNRAEPAAPADGGRDAGLSRFNGSARGRRC
jgi:hypothetical protein